MTEKITLELTKEEFYALDRNIMMVEETESILEKIKEGYKKLEPLKSPAEEAYKRVYAGYPDTSTDDYGIYYDPTWKHFIVGYEAAQKEYKVGEYQETVEERGELHKDVERVVKENLEWFEENPDKDPLDWVKTQTPEETERGIRQQTEKWKEIQKLIDEEDNDKNFKNSLDLIKEWGEKNKPPTLTDIIWNWWEDVFTSLSDLDADASIQDLVNRIDKQFIPPSSATNTYDWERCLKRMKEKLR
jgi:hypothetical protein